MADHFDSTRLRQRSDALRRFSAWEEQHRSYLSAADAVAAIGFLYDQLPAASRVRPVDASGVQTLHRKLAALTCR